MNKEEFLKAIMELSKVETINPISTINSIDVDDLMSAIDRLNKVPTYDELLKENKQLKEQLLVTQDNEETFRLEMEDITQTLGLDEDALFDDVKAYAGSLKDNWNKLKEYVTNEPILDFYNDKLPFEIIIKKIKDKMQELEEGCD